MRGWADTVSFWARSSVAGVSISLMSGWWLGHDSNYTGDRTADQQQLGVVLMRVGALGCRHGAGERYAERRVAAGSRGHHGPGPELKLPPGPGERSAGDGVPRRFLRGDEFDCQLNAAVLCVLCR